MSTAYPLSPLNTDAPGTIASTQTPVMVSDAVMGGSCAAAYPQANMDNYNHYPADYALLSRYNSRLDGYIYGPPIPVTSTAVVSAVTPVWGGVAYKVANFTGALGSSYTNLQAAYAGSGGCGANYASLFR